jgi:hypothetical protein
VSNPNTSTPQPDPIIGQQQYPVTESALRQRSQELGMLGKIFGGRDHAPINIAGTIIILGVLALIAMPFLPESKTLSQADLAKVLSALVLAAFTFLGGYLGGGTKQP